MYQITVTPRNTLAIANMRQLIDTFLEIWRLRMLRSLETLRLSPWTKVYPWYNTLINVFLLNKGRVLPVRRQTGRSTESSVGLFLCSTMYYFAHHHFSVNVSESFRLRQSIYIYWPWQTVCLWVEHQPESVFPVDRSLVRVCLLPIQVK